MENKKLDFTKKLKELRSEVILEIKKVLKTNKVNFNFINSSYDTIFVVWFSDWSSEAVECEVRNLTIDENDNVYITMYDKESGEVITSDSQHNFCVECVEYLIQMYEYIERQVQEIKEKDKIAYNILKNKSKFLNK